MNNVYPNIVHGSLVNVDDVAMELEIAQISDSIRVIELMVMFSAQIQL